MASVNKAIIIGALGRDPEIRYMPNGDAICNISVAELAAIHAKEMAEANGDLLGDLPQ